jgi:serine/threonine-protein phosphatase 4 regulatory subunit 2
MEVFRDLPCAAELSAFCREDAEKREFTDELRGILEVSAMTGLYWHRWNEVKELLLFRLKQVLQDYYKSHADVTVGPPRPLVTGESYQELEDRLTSGLESFTDGAPFTLQRFCEVLLNPRDRYPNLDKVALAFEKLLLVTSTFSPSPGPYPGVASVPAPTPIPAKDMDQKPVGSPKRENVDSTPDVTGKPNDDLVQADHMEEPAAEVVADVEMVDVDSPESKERSVDVDTSQPSEVVAVGEGSKGSASEVPTGKEEWQLVDEADASAAPSTETSLKNASMVDCNESQADVTASGP